MKVMKVWMGIGAVAILAGTVLVLENFPTGTPAHRSVLQPSAEVSTVPYIREGVFSQTMASVVVPYLDRLKVTGTFRGAAGASLFYEAYPLPGAKGTIVISHGLNESAEKYQELSYYFLRAGFSVWAYDHRGHSRSTRLVAGGARVSLDSYGYFADDMKTFLDKVVHRQGGKLFLFAHSMGGGIGALFLERFPTYFDAAVLNAPMMEIDTQDVPETITALAARFGRVLGQGDQFALGETAYSPVPFFAASNTTSWQRYYWYHDLQVRQPGLQNGGFTWDWLDQAMALTREVTEKQNAAKVTIPVLLFQAGRDTLVRPGGQLRFTAAAPNSELVVVPGAKHEIYRETDAILFPYLDQVLGFFTREAAKP